MSKSKGSALNESSVHLSLRLTQSEAKAMLDAIREIKYEHFYRSSSDEDEAELMRLSFEKLRNELKTELKDLSLDETIA